MHGLDENGGVVCHPGCSRARLAYEGWPVPCRRFLIRTEEGRKLGTASTIAVRIPGEDTIVLEVLRNDEPIPTNRRPVDVSLTPRQRDVLRLLADAVAAKIIGQRLEIAEVTVRNHIRAILSELGCHSQLEAVAEARRRGVLDLIVEALTPDRASGHCPMRMRKQTAGVTSAQCRRRSPPSKAEGEGFEPSRRLHA